MKGAGHSNPSTRAGRDMAILSHELDNVLNGLLGLSRLLSESGLNPEQERWSRAIEHAGHQLQALVSAFRDGTGLTRRAPGLTAHPIDGVDLLEQVLLSHAPAAAENGNRLLLTVLPGVPRHWLCDPCLLRQLIDNLLGNAIKFTAGGEVLLQVGTDGRPVGGLRITVADSGPGIDPAAGDRVFEAGVRGCASTPRAFAGSGLGLFVCRLAVAALGGTLGWSARPAGGACFEVLLPGALPEPRPDVAAAPALMSPILRRLHCRLALTEPLRGSVAGSLARLGIRWHDAAANHRDSDAPGSLVIAISEQPAGLGRPGPNLLLTALNGYRKQAPTRVLAGPILCCSLGPALLGMMLEWLWLRNEKRDSAP